MIIGNVTQKISWPVWGSHEPCSVQSIHVLLQFCPQLLLGQTVSHVTPEIWLISDIWDDDMGCFDRSGYSANKENRLDEKAAEFNNTYLSSQQNKHILLSRGYTFHVYSHTTLYTGYHSNPLDTARDTRYQPNRLHRHTLLMNRSC